MHSQPRAPLVVETAGAEQTEAFGARLAACLQAGDVLTLEAPLGAGKTTLTRGLAAGLGVDVDQVSSPTFVIWQIYAGRELQLSHFDTYRLGSTEELEEIGFSECLESGDVVVVEWPEVARPLLPADRLELTLAYADQPDARRIELRPLGSWANRLAAAGLP